MQALKSVAAGLCIDTVVFPSTFCDVASIKFLSLFTGGMLLAPSGSEVAGLSRVWYIALWCLFIPGAAYPKAVHSEESCVSLLH